MRPTCITGNNFVFTKYETAPETQRRNVHRYVMQRLVLLHARRTLLHFISLQDTATRSSGLCRIPVKHAVLANPEKGFKLSEHYCYFN